MPLHELRITPYTTDHTGDSPARVRDWRDTRRMFETTAVISKRRGWRGVFWGMLPKPISMNYPMYPDKWRNRRVEDTLVLKYRIDKKGRVVDVILLQQPRYKEFAETSLAAIRSWKFRPLVINGESKEVIHELTVNFRIEKPYEHPPRPAGGPQVDGPGPPGGPGSPRPEGESKLPPGEKRP